MRLMPSLCIVEIRYQNYDTEFCPMVKGQDLRFLSNT